MKKIYLRFSTLTLILIFTGVIRFVPHPPNFTPLGAMAIFGAAYYAGKWTAYLFPVLISWLTDLLINNIIYREYFDHFTWIYPGAYWTYGAMLLIVFAGVLIIRKVSPGKVLTASLTASVLFFVVSNFGVWFSGNMYPKDWTGLISCYGAGIPFFKNTLMGDLYYSGIMFGAFEFAQDSFPSLKLTVTKSSRSE